MDSVVSIVRALHERYGNSLDSLNRLLRQRVPSRGNRFDHDHPDTFLYIERSKNRNIVAYTARFLDLKTRMPVFSGAGGLCVLNSKDPVHAYFITLEPSAVQNSAAKEKTSAIDELTYIQRKLAYGCSSKSLSHVLEKARAGDIGHWLISFDPHVLSYVALPHLPVLLLVLPPLQTSPEGETSVNGGKECGMLVVLIASISNVLSVLTRIYVRSVEPKHFYQLPSVEYVAVFGVSIETGEDTYQKLEN